MNTRNLTITDLNDPANAEFAASADAAARERAEEIEALTGLTEDQLPKGDVTPAPDAAPADAQPDPNERRVINKSPQDIARENIAKRFNRGEAREFDGDMTKPENLYGDVALPPEEVVEEPVIPEPEPTAAAPAEEMFTIKVRGVEKQVTREQLLEHARKVEAADSYLEEARDLLEQAKGVKNGTATGDSRPPETIGTQDHEPASDDRGAPRPNGEKRKDVIEKIQFGDAEEAAAALDNYVIELATKAVTDTQFAGRLEEHRGKASQTVKSFTAANPTLAANKDAVMLLENHVYEVYRDDLSKLGVENLPQNPSELAKLHGIFAVKGHAVSDPGTILERAKAHVVKVLHLTPDVTTPAPTNSVPATRAKAAPNVQVDVNRTERRAAIPNQPTRAAAPRPNPTQAAQPQSRSDVVNQMRAARGQPVAK